MASNKFFTTALKKINNEYASIVDDGIVGGDILNWVDTGSFALNALLSGSIFGGVAGNKIIGLAGEPAVGKSFYAIAMLQYHLLSDPNALGVYFETEGAITKQMFIDRGMDTSRIMIVPIQTVEQFRTQALQILEQLQETPEKERPKMFFALDSLGNLSTAKEMSDISAGVDKRDMTKQQLLKGAFRAITLKMGILNVPMITTTHVYDQIGAYIQTKVASGGKGLEYGASQILFLSKKMYKNKKDIHVGNIVTLVMRKSRFTIEKKSVQTLLRFDTGLDRYFGLLDLAEKMEVFKKVKGKGFLLPNGETAYDYEIETTPEKYFTKDVLLQIDSLCPGEFRFGTTNMTGLVEDDDDHITRLSNAAAETNTAS